MEYCGKCGAETVRLRRVAAYSHQVSGIAVELRDSVLEVNCDACADTAVVIPNHEGLVAAVALSRVHIPVKLNGGEVRFLRKVLGLTAAHLAVRLDISAEHLSRIERSHVPISAVTERLLRTFVGLEIQDSAPAIDVDLRRIQNMEFSPIRNGLDEKPMQFELVRLKQKDNREKRKEWDTTEAIAA